MYTEEVILVENFDISEKGKSLVWRPISNSLGLYTLIYTR